MTEPLVGHLGVLDQSGRPRTVGQHAPARGLRFIHAVRANAVLPIDDVVSSGAQAGDAIRALAAADAAEVASPA